MPALAAYVGLAPFVLFRPGYDVANLPQSIYVQLGAASLIVAQLLDGYRQGTLTLRVPRVFWPVLGFLTWSLLSLTWALSPREGLAHWLHWLACAGVLLLVARAIDEPDAARRVLVALFASGVGVAVIGLAQHHWGWAWIPQAVPPAASFANKNVAAGYVAATLPLGLVLLSPGRWILAMAGSTAMLLYVFHALTRSAWVAIAMEVACGMVVWCVSGRRVGTPPRLRLAPAIGVGLWALLILLLANLTPSGLRWSMGRAARPLAEILEPLDAGQGQRQTAAPFTSVQHRAAMWANTLVMIRDHPVLGVGFANHAIHYPAYARAALVDREFGEKRHPDFAHNDYLQVAAELGLIGVGLGAWFLVALGRTLRAALGGGSADRRTGVALTLSLVGLLSDALFSFPFERALPPLLTMVLAGIAVNVGSSPTRNLTLPRIGSGAGAALVLAGLFGLGGVSWNRLALDRRLSIMVAAEKRQDWRTVLGVGQGVLRLDPHQRHALLLAGAANVALGRPQEAVKQLQTLLATHPYDMNALGNLALAHEQLGEWSETIACFDRVLRLVPHHARTHYNRARALDGAGRAAEALASYERAYELDPTVPTYAMRAGLSALRAGDYERAVIAFRRAVDLDANSASAHKALGVVLFEMLGRREEGRPHLERALALSPQIQDAARIRALLHHATPR